MSSRTLKIGESLTPVGLAYPFSVQRLKEPPEVSWPETLIVRMWEARNRLTVAPAVMGAPPPLYELFHVCAGDCRTDEDGKVHHRYEAPTEEQCRVASTVIQWLGTHLGRYFMEQYMKAFHEELERLRQERLRQAGLKVDG